LWRAQEIMTAHTAISKGVRRGPSR
jgi:hypothetical protein